MNCTAFSAAKIYAGGRLAACHETADGLVGICRYGAITSRSDGPSGEIECPCGHGGKVQRNLPQSTHLIIHQSEYAAVSTFGELNPNAVRERVPN